MKEELGEYILKRFVKWKLIRFNFCLVFIILLFSFFQFHSVVSRMAKFKFLAQLPVDHIAHPVVLVL